MGKHYNPYEDESLRCVKPEESLEPIEERKSYNDVMEHFDIINGYQIPKKAESLPKKFRTPFRIIVIASLLWFLYSLVANLISIFM